MLSRLTLVVIVLSPLVAPPAPAQETAPYPPRINDGEPLAGTQPLTWQGDLAARMVDNLHAFADRETAASVERRARHWQRALSSLEANRKSLAGNRARLAKYLGVPEPGVVALPAGPQTFGSQETRGVTNDVQLNFWVVPVPDHDFVAEAYELRPLKEDAPPTIVLLSDADQSAEEFLGLNAPDDPGERRIAARLAESGFRVIVPRLVSRDTKYSTTVNGTKQTPQPHREFVYRQAFEMGRSMVGYEVAIVRAMARKFGRYAAGSDDPDVAVVGYGEGGLLALYAGALEPTIDVVGVSGYFAPREGLWREPIYRNVWGLLDEFGDAELAAMIAPNKLVVEAAATPQVDAPIGSRDVRSTNTPGTIATPPIAEVRREFQRAKDLVVAGRGSADFAQLIESGDGAGPAWSEPFLQAVVATCDPSKKLVPTAAAPRGNVRVKVAESNYTPVKQLVDYTQALLAESEYVRKDYWKDADRKSRDPEKWEASLGSYRDALYDDVLGRFRIPLVSPTKRARSRLIYDTPQYRGYEVVLDVFDADDKEGGVFAFGTLLVPKDIKPGERRPVVVCQHGLEGRPEDTIVANIRGSNYYHMFAARLAERGFVTFAPQNPYIGQDIFRTVVRKLYPLKKTLWSIIVPQHEQITGWLAAQEFVDPKRIAFYGLSYGGKTAMRVPALVDRYCLSICSGDFNEWVRKCTTVRDAYSYMGTSEYEMYEFNLGHTFNYAEMAYLIAPRPFMVERGHRDGVGVDEWVSYEFAKVRMLYADLKIPERTEIEYFDGPHEIHAVGTFDFLHRHLKWPAPK